VNFRQTNLSIRQLDACHSFHLSPAPFAVTFSQACNFSNGRAEGDGFDVDDFTDNLEAHQPSLYPELKGKQAMRICYGNGCGVVADMPAAQRLGQPRHRKTTHFLGKTG
jgi:hypothetical protein